MGEKKPFPTAVVQNTIAGILTTAIMGILLHVLPQFGLPQFGFSWLIVGIFVFIGAVAGILSGLERMRVAKLESEKDAMQVSFGQLEFSLKRSAHQYKVLLDNLSDAVFQTNENGKFVYFNQATMLLSGYSPVELKQMRLSQIQLKNEDRNKEEASILDNNIYRHKERWRNKEGFELVVEINTRLIQSMNRTYELHIARDITKRSGHDESNIWLKEIQHWHYGKIKEESHFRNRFYNQIQLTLNNLSKLLTQFMQEYPRKSEEISKILSDWKRTRNLLQLFIAKNNRDMHSRQSYWDVNEILLQELSYLKTSMSTEKITIQVQFGSNLMKTKMAGNDLTLAFGLLLHSISQGIIEAGGGQLRVVSGMTADSLFVEFHASNAKNYNTHFLNALQMTSDNPFVQLPNVQKLPNVLFAFMNLNYDSMQDGGKLIVKVRLPFERKVLEQQPRPPSPEKGPEPPKARDYVVL